MPLRPLLLLLAVVFGAHWAVLGTASVPVRVSERVVVPTFVTRSVAGELPAQTAQPPPDHGAADPAPLRFEPTAPRPRPRPRPPESATSVIEMQAPLPSPEPTIVKLTAAAGEPVARGPATTPQSTLRFNIPPAVHLRYVVTAAVRQMRLQGEGELLWRHDGNSYDARLELSAPFLPRRVQHSAGLITAEGLAPLRFSDKVRSEEAAHFVRDQGKVSFSSNRPDAAWVPGMQDRLSVMLQLGAMVGGAPDNFPPGTVISVPTASTREAEPWLFTVEGQETLDLAGGKVDTLRLLRNPRREFDQKVELWLAPAMDYVPVRVRLTQANGDWVDQQWSSTDRR